MKKCFASFHVHLDSLKSFYCKILLKSSFSLNSVFLFFSLFLFLKGIIYIFNSYFFDLMIRILRYFLIEKTYNKTK